MQVGACLLLDAGPAFDLSVAQRLVAERVRAVPRLRQRLVRTPPGCGRPVWVDDPSFDISRHLRRTRCPPPGDERALLDLAADVITEPLPDSRPLWSAVFVTGLADHNGRDPHDVALVVCFHHVLADGIGGLAVLASLVDGMPVPPPGPFPRPAPSGLGLAASAWVSRLRVLARLPATLLNIGGAAAELGARSPVRAARCSLNSPSGRKRWLAVVTARLDAVRLLAHASGGTVNDAILTAVTGAVRELLRSRGEVIPALVVSAPVSARASATAGHLGNQSGVMPVALPVDGSIQRRLERIAAITRAHKVSAPGASAGLLAGAFRLLAGFGVYGWFINHQRMIHTYVSNLRGPDQPLTLGGAAVSAVIPITLITGNVTVAFGALSYAGTLAITIIADPDAVPDMSVLTTALRAELASCG